MSFEQELADLWEYCRSWTQSYATGISLRDPKKVSDSYSYASNAPRLKVIILKHRVALYRYQKTVFEIACSVLWLVPCYS